MINQAKLRSFRSAPVYMYGQEVPRNHAKAMELDRKNGNTKWADSEGRKTSQKEYDGFGDRGHKSTAIPPKGYKRITVYFVYAVKHGGRYKSRVVAGGHLTETPAESVYYGVVSLRSVRLVVFLVEFNTLKV